MQDKTKNMIITIGFVVVLIGIFLANLIAEDKAISISERRKLAQFPEISINKILSGDVIDKWENYVEDQFWGRDVFRTIKSIWNTKVFAQKDDNKIFEKDNAIYKMEYPLNENNMQKSAQKLKDVYEKYLKGMNVYYSIIPDKNYFLTNDDHLKMDYEKIRQIVGNELQEAKYIDIRGGLELDTYYRTDIHWRQEKLQSVADILQNNMGIESIDVKYEMEDRGDFYGSYYGQIATKVPPDTMYTLMSDTINNCAVYDVDKNKNISVYVKPDSTDKYDTFLAGSKPLIIIDNPNAKTEKELLLFRDSFGSSIAPLLIENYSKLTLIDLRMISRQLLGDYIEFEDQDVLFLYNSLVLNNNTFQQK